MWVSWVVWGLIGLNAVLAMITVFWQPRDIAATWAWLLVLLLLPVLGLGLYWVFGRKLTTKKLNALATQQKAGSEAQLAGQQAAVKAGQALSVHPAVVGASELVRLLLKADDAPMTTQNAVTLISQREQFTKALFQDIAAAKDHIHIEAYTIEPDGTGRALLQLLTTKAKAGVTVHLMYDTFGSHRLNRRFWRPLVAAGGQVVPFIATRLGRANPRINFRNHRKLAVVDGRVGYVGGFDIGSSPKRLPIHRDTQLRLTGPAVVTLQTRFFMDWNTTVRHASLQEEPRYFPKPKAVGDVAMQIVAGGPEQPFETLKLGYLRLIALAKTRIWMQTPYFVPDDSLLDALFLAVSSGIDVRLMVPQQTNQPLMAKATRFYLDRLVQAGARVYRYQAGFLHAKSIVVDNAIVATGTANFDIRSFKLNFEIAAVLYDRRLATEAAALFAQDMHHAVLYDAVAMTHKTTRQRMGEEWARLLAPIL